MDRLTRPVRSILNLVHPTVFRSSDEMTPTSEDLRRFAERMVGVAVRVDDLQQSLVDSERGERVLADIRAIPDYALYARYWGDAADFHESNLCRPYILWRQPDRRLLVQPVDDGSPLYPLCGLIDLNPVHHPEIRSASVSADELQLLREMARHRMPQTLPGFCSSIESGLAEDDVYAEWRDAVDRVNAFYAGLDGSTHEDARSFFETDGPLAAPRTGFFVEGPEKFARVFDSLLTFWEKPKDPPRDPWGFEELFWEGGLDDIEISPEAKRLLDVWKNVRSRIDELHAELGREVQGRWRDGLIRCASDPQTAEDFALYCRFCGVPELCIVGETRDWDYADGEICPCLVSGMRYESDRHGRPNTDEERAIVAEFQVLENVSQARTRASRVVGTAKKQT